jgi:hypothetical protein
VVKGLIALAIVAAGAAAVIFVTKQDPVEPRLHIDDSVATDFDAVAEETWDRFLVAFPAQLECIGDITLVADYDLEDRARYDPDQSQMAVRVPGPRVLLERAVVHELAHHLEFNCDSHEAVRPAFLAALGRDGDAPWFEGEAWENTPSEVFAETVVEVVFEDFGMVHTGIGLIASDAVEIVADWGTSS